MFRRSLSTALTLLLLASPLSAQEAMDTPPPPPEPTEASALQDTISELDARLAQLERENTALREQLEQARAEQPLPLLDDEQRWFVVGGAVAALSFIIGVLYSRGQRRRQWLN